MQYTELQQKQISDWNKHWKEKMDVPKTPQWKARLTSQQEISESSDRKLDWMIKWMQETGLIFQEFAAQNNMRVPNYSSNMFGLMHFQPEPEELGNEKREDSKDEEGEEEGNEMNSEEEEEEDNWTEL